LNMVQVKVWKQKQNLNITSQNEREISSYSIIHFVSNWVILQQQHITS
jgi:hypothetical protein